MIDKQMLIEKMREDEKYSELLQDILDGLYDLKDYKVLSTSFIGGTIQDFFCNGFFGSRTFDLSGAEITKIYKDEDDEIVIEVRKIDGGI